MYSISEIGKSKQSILNMSAQYIQLFCQQINDYNQISI